MTERENFIAMLNGEPAEFTPCNSLFNTNCGGLVFAIDGYHPGPDGFGVNWVGTVDGCLPEPGNFRFTADDIENWRDYVTFPDVDALPVEQIYEMDKPFIDRENKIVTLTVCTGPFERLVSFMGFEEALIALVESPEACKDFVEAFTDFRIKELEKAIPIYQPDMIMEADDIAASLNLFMSPETWREVFKPGKKRLGEFIRANNIIFGAHICGRIKDIIPDLVEIGLQYWNSAQKQNDLPEIMTKYPKLIVDGGWDSSGPAGRPDATKEVILAEGERCMREYGKFNNFILFPLIFDDQGQVGFFREPDDRLLALWDYWVKNGRKH